MSNPHSSDDEWTEWIEVQKAALRKEIADGISVIDSYLRAGPPLDLKRQALGFRGSLRQEQGALMGAKEDFLAALELTEKPDFERYTLEQSVSAISEQMGDDVEAERWCLSALRTAAADPTTSGAGSLLRLLRLRGGQGFSSEERRLAKKVVYQAWSLLRVEGEPDLTDLVATAKKLLEAQRRPFSANRPPTPKAYTEPAEDD